MAGTVLVALKDNPSRRLRISKEKYDIAVAAAKEAGNESPFIDQEEDCEGGASFDQLSKAEQTAVGKRQKERQEKIDAAKK